jgi:hypothetical protein
MTIFLDDETTWPADVLGYLNQNYALFLAWERRRDGKKDQSVNPSDYDSAICRLRAVLSGHLLHGYHCTRLTESEMQNITLNGMQLPSEAMLHDRIRSIENAGLIESQIAARLSNENQASESNRTKKIWFCFYPPRAAGQRGIERFFRCWGGEALYNSHEDDPVTGPILNCIGKPCLIEADVPIASLEIHSYLDDKVIRRFLIRRGYKTSESIDHDDRAKTPLLPDNIRRIIRYSDPEFVEVTGCNTWSPPLTP